jgi:hypothetical protein
VKNKGQREKDIAGHLLSEKEKEAAKKANPNVKVEAWWKDAASKKDENRTPKEKLLGQDYQIYQAFNYLKAWKLMKGM